jgi:hypothetical protein
MFHGRPEFLVQLEQLANEVGAEFYEKSGLDRRQGEEPWGRSLALACRKVKDLGGRGPSPCCR